MHGFTPAAQRMAQLPKPGPRGFAAGGLIRGPGTGTSDSIPAEVPQGSYILPADTTHDLGLAPGSAAEKLSSGVPVALSNGEWSVTPEQVQQIGAGVLDILRGVTHEPTEQEGAASSEPVGFAGPAGFADGGLVDSPAARALGSVSRVGNSYSGGNVGGAVTINGQAPAGTYSENPAGFAPRAAAPAVPQPRPSADMTTLSFIPPAQAALSTLPARPGYADGGLVDDPRRRPNSFGDAAAAAASPGVTQVGAAAPPPPAPAPAAAPAPLAAQRLGSVADIPTGGMQAPAADGSQNNPLTNNDVGRNALNTLSALPGAAGFAGRAAAPTARAVGGVAQAERAAPAAWEVVQEGGALARSGGDAAQRLAQLGGNSGGALTRAAGMAPPSAAQQLAAPAGQLAQRGASQVGEAAGFAGRARQATQWADVVEPAALGAPAASGGAAAAGAGASGVGRAAGLGAAGVGAAALLGADSQPAGAAGVPAPAIAGAPPAAAPAQPSAAATLASPPVTQGFITRNGNSYSGPAGISGDVDIRNADGTSRSAPAGFAPGGAAAQLATLPTGGVPTPGAMAAADNLAARSTTESLARLGLPGAPAGFSGSIGQPVSNGNMWARTPEQQRQDAATQATSIQRGTAARGQAAVDAFRAQDMMGIRNEGALDVARLQDGGATARAGIQERGANTRAAIEAQGRVAAAAQGRAVQQAPAGYRWTAGGSLEAIQGGPADPNVRGARAPLNDVQSKALQFGTRMQTAGQVLDGLAGQGVDRPGDIKRAADSVGLGAAANWTQSPQQQQVEQAQRDFINAVLRRESGAAIADSEFANARQQYFPQVGDTPEVVAQKRRNREIATNGILAEVPDAEKRVNQVLSGTPITPNSGAAPAPRPATATPAAGGSVQVSDAASYQALPSGALYTTPSGEVRRKK